MRHMHQRAGFEPATISVDSAGRAFDNIMVERLGRTVKYKDVYLRDHQTPTRARLGLARYFAYYNHRQRHRNLGLRTSARVYALEALPEEKSKSVIAFPPRNGIIETGDGRSAAAHGAVAPGSFRNRGGKRYPWARFHLIPTRKLFSLWGQVKVSCCCENLRIAAFRPRSASGFRGDIDV
ncbi:MAG: transposase [Phycisphaerae bacterium]|nr:transposase [Phycisphaerae bacterium]